MNVSYECDGMNVCTQKYQNKQKEWHHDAAKPLILRSFLSSSRKMTVTT